MKSTKPFTIERGNPVVVVQSSSSFVLSVIKTEVPLDCDDLARKDLLLQQYGERIEKLSQQDKLSKFCMDAGFLNVVEIGQYFMTKDTAEFSQFHAVACREHTLPREEEVSQPKGWNPREHQNWARVGKLQLLVWHGKFGVEIRISSVNRDTTHSWVRISHASNKFVMNLSNNEQEIPEVQLEEFALKLNAKDFACRSKAKAKPQRREPAGSSIKTIPIRERTWTDVEPGEHSISDYEVSKKLIIEKMMERLNSGELKTIFRNISRTIIIGLTKSGRTAWQEEEETRKDFNIVLINQEQSCTSELIKVIQDAVSLILLYRTMSLFRTVSSSAFVMSDVQSIHIPSSIED